MENVREFLDEVEKKLNAPGIERGSFTDLGHLENEALEQYEIFLSEEVLQFIKRSSSAPVKHWIVKIVGRQQLKTQNPKTLPNVLILYGSLLKNAIQDIPASLSVAKEIITFSTIMLNSSLRLILLQSSTGNLLTQQMQLNQQILSIKDSPSATLRNHAFKFIERLILCFSYAEGQNPSPSGDSFSLSEIKESLPPPFTVESLAMLGRNLLGELIETLQRFASNTKKEPKNANIPNQVIIINSLVIIQSNRARQFANQIIVALSEVTQQASLSWNANSQSRSLSYTLRHALISIMLTNKWETGTELLSALTRLDAKDRAESLYKQLRPLEFRDLKRSSTRSNTSFEVQPPPAKRQRIDVPSTPSGPSASQTNVANFIVNTLNSLNPPDSFKPLQHINLDIEKTRRIFQELEIIIKSFAGMIPAISSVAETNPARDPRAKLSSNNNNNIINENTVTKTNETPKDVAAPILKEAAKKIGLPIKTSTVPTSKEETLEQSNKAIERIIQQEIGAKRSGKDLLRRRLVTRMICLQKNLEHPLVQSMIKFLMDEFPSRIDLAVQWLYQEYYQCLLDELPPSAERQPDSWEKAREIIIAENSRYYKLLKMIMEQLCIALQPSKESDPLFRSFILQVPDLSNHTIQTLRGLCDCDDPDRVLLGLTSFREIILNRPASRNIIFELLLKYSVFPKDDSTRLNAIQIIIDSLYSNIKLKDKISEFAFETAKTLNEVEEVINEIESLPSTVLPVGQNTSTIINDEDDEMYDENEEDFDGMPVDDDGYQDEDMDEDDQTIVPIGGETTVIIPMELPTTKLTQKQVKQKLQLFIKVCSLDYKFLFKFLDIYKNSIQSVRSIIEIELKDLFSKISQTDDIIIDLLTSHPKESEPLLETMIKNIIGDSKINIDLKELLQKLYNEDKLSAEFLVPTLQSLDKQKILEYLPSLISIPSRKTAASAMFLILSTPPSDKTITPTELLINLHTLDSKHDDVDIKNQFHAIKCCFKAPVIDKQTLAVVLQQLTNISQIPKLLLRTMIDSYKKHPELKSFILELLSTLVSKQVWNQKESWDGFIKCIELLKPKSFEILLTLPPNILKDALPKFDDKIREEFLLSCEQLNIPKQLSSILDSFRK